MNINTKLIKRIKGFISLEESKIIYNLALEASNKGVCLEVGSYCGKSAICIGVACKEEDNVLFSIDNHKGSEEQQPGEKYFDPFLFDFNRYNFFFIKNFLKNTNKSSLHKNIISIFSNSKSTSKKWKIKLGLVFLDGSHHLKNVLNDYYYWSNHISPGGYLVFHDIYRNPNKGGQSPYKIYKLAISSKKFIKHKIIRSLGILVHK